MGHHGRGEHNPWPSVSIARSGGDVWSEDQKRALVAAAFAPDAIVAEVAKPSVVTILRCWLGKPIAVPFKRSLSDFHWLAKAGAIGVWADRDGHP